MTRSISHPSTPGIARRSNGALVTALARLARTAVPALAAGALAAGAPAAAHGEGAGDTLPAFVAGLPDGIIAAISDGDFEGQTYATGRLASRAAGHRDLLTVLAVRDGWVSRAVLPVSNSVTAAPEILALTRDGRTAFVTERLGERPPGGDTIKDLPPGRRLFAVDLSEPAAPRLAATAGIEAFPEALAASPDGRRVAVVSNTAQRSTVQIVSYAGGAFGPVATFDLADLGITGSAQAPRGGVTATNVQWHPSGRYIAVNINTQNRVAFFSVAGPEQGHALRPWGEPVATGPDPFVGRFTPDGRHYLTSDWGRNFAATDLEGRIPTTPSAVSVIRLADAGTAAAPNPDEASPRHRRVGSTITDLSAEGIAVSPDGRLVATVNMRGTAFLPDSPRFERMATVSLLSLDPGTGALRKLADYPLQGVLPEGGAFDPSGCYFYATVFHGHAGAGPQHGAGLETFLVVTDGAQPALQRLGRIPMPHGVHHVDVAQQRRLSRRPSACG